MLRWLFTATTAQRLAFGRRHSSQDPSPQGTTKISESSIKQHGQAVHSHGIRKKEQVRAILVALQNTLTQRTSLLLDMISDPTTISDDYDCHSYMRITILYIRIIQYLYLFLHAVHRDRGGRSWPLLRQLILRICSSKPLKASKSYESILPVRLHHHQPHHV